MFLSNDSIQMKHAFLIMAHNEFPLLRLLVSCIDDTRNDIYIHIDRKVTRLPELHAERAGLHILENRVDVHWGDLSVVEAEYALFEEAVAHGPYLYYHLLSGVDLPIKSQDYIHSFFDVHAGKEFIGYTLTEITPEVVRKVMRWHLFPEDFKNQSIIKRVIRAIWIRLQEWFGFYRNVGVEFKKGSQWISVTDGMARFFLSRRKWVETVFTHTFCSDELVMQTLCWLSPFRKNIYNTETDGDGCLRAIGWRNGCLFDWGPNDLVYLKESKALFARKFNTKDMLFLSSIISLSKTSSDD